MGTQSEQQELASSLQEFYLARGIITTKTNLLSLAYNALVKRDRVKKWIKEGMGEKEANAAVKHIVIGTYNNGVYTPWTGLDEWKRVEEPA